MTVTLGRRGIGPTGCGRFPRVAKPSLAPERCLPRWTGTQPEARHSRSLAKQSGAGSNLQSLDTPRKASPNLESASRSFRTLAAGWGRRRRRFTFSCVGGFLRVWAGRSGIRFFLSGLLVAFTAVIGSVKSAASKDQSRSTTDDPFHLTFTPGFLRAEFTWTNGQRLVGH